MTPTPTETIVRRATADPQACSCHDPIPVERAERKGAAVRAQLAVDGTPSRT